MPIEQFLHRLESALPGGAATLTWGAAALLVLFALWLLRLQLSRWLAERRIRLTLGCLGRRRIHDVMLDDGMDSLAFIDHAVLTPDGIFVFGIQRTHGVIFAGEGMDQWANVIDARSYKFPNPLPAAETAAQAVRLQLPGAPVQARVLFAHGSRFPKGKPEAVWLPADVRALKQAWGKRPVPEALGEAWESLVRRVRKVPPAYARELAVIGRLPGRRRALLGMLLLLAAAAWLGWRLSA